MKPQLRVKISYCSQCPLLGDDSVCVHPKAPADLVTGTDTKPDNCPLNDTPLALYTERSRHEGS